MCPVLSSGPASRSPGQLGQTVATRIPGHAGQEHREPVWLAVTPALSLFAGSQDPPASTMPPALAPHCCCSPPVPSPGRGRLQARRQLSVACTICCIFMVGEVIGNSGMGMGMGTGGCRGRGCQLLCNCRRVPGAQPGHHDGCSPPADGCGQHVRQPLLPLGLHPPTHQDHELWLAPLR